MGEKKGFKVKAVIGLIDASLRFSGVVSFAVCLSALAVSLAMTSSSSREVPIVLSASVYPVQALHNDMKLAEDWLR